MFDMTKMLGKVKEMQAKMQEAQEELVKIQEEGESGAGLVKATVNGHKRVIKIDIDVSLMKPEEKHIVEDLTTAAINRAMAKVDEQVKKQMQASTEGMMPNIPGVNLEELLGKK